MARKRVKCHIRSHFRTMNSTFISDKMGENARSNANCLSEAYQKLNLAYCLSLSDSSFGLKVKNVSCLI